MTSRNKLQDAVHEATLQGCPKCGHKRFASVTTVYEDCSGIEINEEGDFDYDDANYA